MKKKLVNEKTIFSKYFGFQYEDNIKYSSKFDVLYFKLAFRNDLTNLWKIKLQC